eukprot:TRINITY_DN7712_c0_g1_i1.p1 TRINITY_DN7712_c0_g1~~TRINITY_DN7712_c0_g1_i1.p1  ORF type:complete len:443 (-),score=105.32 TRINITY_DN7712_c0_g1_i1:23-1351(-)
MHLLRLGQRKLNISPARRTLCSSGQYDVFTDLKNRGLLQDTTAEVSQIPRNCAVYVGFDPTASSLHIGNLLQITTLQRLSNGGYKPIALIGGATGQIGDPSGRSSERNLLSGEEVDSNVKAITQQFKSFFKGEIEIQNNIGWYKDMFAIEFLRDIGKLFRVNTMLAKDSVKSRIETDHQGISFTEFSYQILQAYDFYHLYKNHNCKIQFGGSDQWGNITAGIEFIKKKSQDQGFGFTLPLVTDSEGKKIGKSSAGGQVWLDPAKTSVYDFYQFWINIPDTDLPKMLKVFTFFELSEIESIIEKHNEQPEKRYGQGKLAAHMTEYIYGKEKTLQAVAATKVAFGADLSTLTVEEIELAFKDSERLVCIPEEKVFGQKVVDVALAARTAVSKSQVLKLLRGGGLYLNNKKVESEDAIFEKSDLLGGKIGVFRSGKKNYHLFKLE